MKKIVFTLSLAALLFSCGQANDNMNGHQSDRNKMGDENGPTGSTGVKGEPNRQMDNQPGNDSSTRQTQDRDLNKQRDR